MDRLAISCAATVLASIVNHDFTHLFADFDALTMKPVVATMDGGDLA